MGLLFKAILEQLAIRGQRERDRREEWERSLKPTVYLGNNLFQEMGGQPLEGRYLGQRSLIPGQFVPNIGRNPNKPVIPGLPIPVETIEEDPILLIPSACLVYIEPIDDTGFRAIYYRGSQAITLGDFRVYYNGLDNIRDYHVAWVYDNSINYKWRKWVIWIRVTEIGNLAPGGNAGRREVNFGVKGSSTTVIESRIYARIIYGTTIEYSFATDNDPLSYALYDSLSYGTTVITPEDFLDTYNSDDPENDFRLERLRWDYNPLPTVNVIDENTVEVLSELTGRWIKFSNFNRTGTIIGGTTR